METGKQTQYSIVPQTTLDNLAANEVFKQSILNEIKSRGEKIDLRPPIREYISCLVRIHAELRKIFSEIFNRSRSIYSEAVKEYSETSEKAHLHI
jgi:hypothetical protein